jgi:antitoxin (DNA-binding transcriptional repressor) of toxin-antitoxin stability system
MKVSAQYAEAHFADILNAASNGEEVEIALPDKPRRELWRAWEGRTARRRIAP